MTLILKSHWAGFFSCCSLRLSQIIEHIKNYKHLPELIDNRESFLWYNPDKNIDILSNFFKNYDSRNIEYSYSIENIIHINWGDIQFTKYNNLPFNELNPLIKLYFSPSENIINLIKQLKNKYNVNTLNTCAVFLRGNDKVTECSIPDYNQYIEYIDDIKIKNENIKFIFQSDETEFLNFMINKYPNNIIFKDEIRHISKNSHNTVDNYGNTTELNFEYAIKFLAIVYIMAQCNYIICNTGNISMWMSLFRGNTENLIQI